MAMILINSVEVLVKKVEGGGKVEGMKDFYSYNNT
jgi:hypothetical protein